MSAPVIGKLGVMMKILTFVVVMATFCSFNAYAVKARSCENLEVEYIKLQLQNGNLSQKNISDREFKRGTLGIAEMCELRSELVSDGLTFTLIRPKGESSNYILVHNGLDGSFKLYGPFCWQLHLTKKSSSPATRAGTQTCGLLTSFGF